MSGPAPTQAQGPQAALPALPQTQVPLTLCNMSKTTVWDFGRVASAASRSSSVCPAPPAAPAAADELWWHVVAGRRAFPLPPGYRATCSAYGRALTLTVESRPVGEAAAAEAPSGSASASASGGSTQLARRRTAFVLTTGEGAVHEGSTPTAPLASLALALGEPLVLSGLEAYGCLAAEVQQALRAAAAAAGLPLDQPAAGMGGHGGTTTAPASAVQAWLQLPGPAPASAPLPPQAARRPPLPRTLTVVAPSAPAFVSPFASPEAQVQAQLPATAEPTSQGGIDGGGGGGDWLEGELAGLAARPPSRAQRRRAASAGGAGGARGWTAFTAFGVQHREGVRAAHPRSGAKEVEKLLGQQWAALPAEHKRRYADLAARVRSEGGAGGTGGLNRAVSEPGAHTTPDERPQRPTRPNSRFAGLYDTSPSLEGDGAAADDSDSEGEGRAARRGGPLKRRHSTPAGSGTSRGSGDAKRSRKAAQPRVAAAGDVPPGAATFPTTLLGLLEAAGSTDLQGWP